MCGNGDYQWTDENTNIVYDLQHMKSFSTDFEIKFNKEIHEIVRADIIFSNHCWTRKRLPGDLDNQVVDRYSLRDGTVEERVFCVDRWEFSKSLPEIINALNYKLCLVGGSREILYRQESSSVGSHAGWYICIRLDFKRNHATPLQLWVRSAHYRSNRPEDIRRHGGAKFCILLKDYLNSKRYLQTKAP